MNLSKIVYLGVVIPILFASCASSKSAAPLRWNSGEEPLREMERLRSKIKAPRFAQRDFKLTDYGAIGDGKTLNTVAFEKAILACNKAGGGRVVVPAGKFLTGAIYLKSNVNLHVEEGTTILFSTNPAYYPIVFTRWEGMELMNYSALIYAFGEENIGITGKGTLDGQAGYDNWWAWNRERPAMQLKARNLLHEYNHASKDPNTRIFGEGHFLRPNFIQTYNCKNVLISGVKLLNSPMWNINPVLCEQVIIEDVTIIGHGPNNDGIDPESCRNVLIRNCYFDTGDDCIAIKSGRDEDGRRIARPAENHIIEGCEMKEGHGGIVIGSEISGGAKNIYAINCKMNSPNLDRILRIKTSSSRGGVIENVFMKNVEVGTYREAAVLCSMFYEQPGNFMPVIRNIWVENMTVKDGGKYGVFINAYKESPVKDLRMINCTINGVQVPQQIDYATGTVYDNVIINDKKAAPEVKGAAFVK
ncbi:MAG: glycoside hydrolase family 28 protein [Chitinophagaceae bacterium]|nr:MAG: glycoside hydrolase family 28 protein [Chitinophagaceae bacterium]